MITPRSTRLLRVPDLQARHEAIFQLVAPPPADTDLSRRDAALRVRDTAIIVSTRGAAEELRRTIEKRVLADDAAIVLPDCLTRADFYLQAHQRAPGLPRRLTDFEREVLFRRAAHEAIAEGVKAPFVLRAGLIVELLNFYDELRRRDRTLEVFDRLMNGALEPSVGSDRGAARLLDLTHFLTAAFRALERLTASSGCLDEHGLRARLLTVEAGIPGACPYRHIVVTVVDQAADPRGLWMADFDLLARMPGLVRLDILVTEHVLASGFHERIHDALPGIEVVRLSSAGAMPVLAAPEPVADQEPLRWFVCRDREEELVEVARMARARQGVMGRTAVVFQRPLPYLYLARRVFPDAQVPYEALDALPLASEPFAAALDLVFTFLLAEGNRASLVGLLGSPHWTFDAGGQAIGRREVSAADALLRELKYLGGWDRLSALAARAPDEATEGATDRRREGLNRAAPALEAAGVALKELDPVLHGPSASAQVAALLAFVETHERLPQPGDSWYASHLRARSAVLAALASLRDAHLQHDDRPLPLRDLAGTIRRWIEGQTFSPRTGAGGILLVDAAAAAYADVDEVRLVGLVESDWPDRPRRSIFYPSSLLLPLGWPPDAERLAGARARFHDLLLLARRRVSASTFTLEDDAIVTPSTFLEELEPAGLPVERVPAPVPRRVFLHEAISIEPVAAAPLDEEPGEWLALRLARSNMDAPAFRGAVGERPAAVYAVSRVERYLECPFKYFAAHVLRLREEREDESTLSPQERGQLLHDVFEAFFRKWQGAGRGAITTGNVAVATELFAEVAESRLATLPEADRALERTHLLGSAAAAGLAERAFSFEIEQGGVVLERLLEHSLEGEFEFRAGERVRRVAVRAKADRIDLLDDGSLRVIDYKLSKAPKASRALQLPVYGVCAEQHLAGRHGRSWTLGRAGYVAFRERNAFTALGGSTSLADAVAEGQARFLDTLEGIERGEFPVRPEEPFLCTRCGFATVCRKDYVGDE
ncbi:MAG: PD-(D/E)XK nuclease family protein [Acidobacteria bacterium]|nr:PD-(D/E)XK nuclease family protein [Acidobacteriota bacterium]